MAWVNGRSVTGVHQALLWRGTAAPTHRRCLSSCTSRCCCGWPRRTYNVAIIHTQQQ